ncbi:hypothetical protein HYDPIDRAFT_31147 [Hydnomerulius pinastri MD-312]|uniref:Rab-GAP TBC domain-containing protein n=1 Tax=Hydnomerulius pinastri MD-312 TaxID=994086 RepID=A0A0C9WBV5_9AGAM|nr:hypothetical protein HYDPIDRAFT_31147 [Hydnomerulius pinastri MD-312]
MDTTTNDEELTWESLLERSLRPGGFGEDRVRIWPAVLGVQPLADPPPYTELANEAAGLVDESTNDNGGYGYEETDPHADERQIGLDTDRSFVLYPVESSGTPPRDALQTDLHSLLVSLFRKRRSLRYFQGFHDILSVLFLTLPRPLHLACAEKMALHRVRDAMGAGLEPILGLLRVLRNLLRLVDPDYAELLESTSPLPYHALPHLLTLFSHDVPTLPLIQHVWDFLLVREPIAVVWLVAALVLHRKPSVHLLAEQDEEGMIHSLLGGLPELVDAEPEPMLSDLDNVVDADARGAHGNEHGNEHPQDAVTALEDPTNNGDGGLEAILDEEGNAYQSPAERKTSGRHAENEHAVATLDADEDKKTSRDTIDDTRIDQVLGLADSDTIMSEGVELLSSTASPSADSRQPSNTVPSPDSALLSESVGEDSASAAQHESPKPGSPAVGIPSDSRSHSLPSSSRSTSPEGSISPSRSSQGDVTLAGSPDLSASKIDPSASPPRSRPTHPSSLEPSSTASLPPTRRSSGTSSRHTSPSRAPKSRSKPVPLSLPQLLRQTEALLATYPPSHPSLHVSEIMGPDSVVRTWQAPTISAKAGNTLPEKVPYSQTDDYLESLAHSSHVVIPSPPPSPLLLPRLPEKKLRPPPKSAGKGLLRRGVGFRLGALTPAERRVLLAGALLVVGAAIALKVGKVPCVSGLVDGSGGEGLKRLWHGKWSLVSSVVAAWGRGLP